MLSNQHIVSKIFTVSPTISPIKTACIEITCGPYEGIEYYYEYVKLGDGAEDPSAEGLRLQFSYKINNKPENFDDTLLEGDNLKLFETLVGDILVFTITKTGEIDSGN